MRAKPTLGPGVGFFPEDVDIVVYCRVVAGVALGDLVQFNHDATLDEVVTTTTKLGDADSPMANIEVAQAANTAAEEDQIGWLFGFVVDTLTGAGANDTLILIRLQGWGSVKETDVTTCGAQMVASAGVTIMADAATENGAKIIGITTNEDDQITTGQCEMLFDGINGFGTVSGQP